MNSSRLCFLIAAVLFAIGAILSLVDGGVDFPWLLAGLTFHSAGHLV